MLLDEIEKHGIERRNIMFDVWRKFGVSEKIKFQKVESNEDLANSLSRMEFDFAFIDGAHTYKDVKANFEAVKKCGRVLFHDYENPMYRGSIVKYVDSIKEGTVIREEPFAYWEGDNHG